MKIKMLLHAKQCSLFDLLPIFELGSLLLQRWLNSHLLIFQDLQASTYKSNLVSPGASCRVRTCASVSEP